MRHATVLILLAGHALAAPPRYTIVDLGVVGSATASQGNRVSTSGVYATGRALGTGTASALVWSSATGTVGLPLLAGRAYAVGNGVNDSGDVGGTVATTAFGSGPLPVVWQAGVLTQLPLPSGQSLGRVYDLNNLRVAVGSVNGGSLERGAIFTLSDAGIISATAPGGSFFNAAFAINNHGMIVGTGWDPNNAARNVGMVYEMLTGMAFEVGALPGRNGALNFDVSDAGHVVGSSMLNQGSGTPFIWTQAGGMVEIPLPVGTSQGTARGVNSRGWAVGVASGAFAIPFLWDGAQTYRLADMLPPGSPWDLATNTSSAALSISDTGVIVGTGVLAGQIRAFAMLPACTVDLNADGAVDFNDYLEFLNLYNSNDPRVDFNADGAVDFNDYLEFLNLYNQGC